MGIPTFGAKRWAIPSIPSKLKALNMSYKNSKFANSILPDADIRAQPVPNLQSLQWLHRLHDNIVRVVLLWD